MQNPITTPRGFFDRVVVPDVAALKEDVEDVRLAFHAAISLHQLPDWICGAGLVLCRDPSKYLKSLYPRHPGLETIRALALNAKHFPPDRAARLAIGTSAGPALSLSNTPLCGPNQMQVLAKDEHGKNHWVISVISDAFDFWSEEMAQYQN
jgi:hypothetical protein